MEVKETSQPVSQEVPEKKPKYWLIAILLIVILLISTGLVYAGFLLGRRSIPPRELLELPKSQPSPIQIDEGPVLIEVSPTPDITANWKTYTNNFAKFTLKYPLSMSFSEKTFSAKERQVVFNGPQGELIINMAVPTSSGWGGGCDPEYHKKVEFLGEQKETCLGEEWLNHLYVNHPTGFSQFQIAANFASPFSENKDLIFQILSTFKFLD